MEEAVVESSIADGERGWLGLFVLDGIRYDSTGLPFPTSLIIQHQPSDEFNIVHREELLDHGVRYGASILHLHVLGESYWWTIFSCMHNGCTPIYLA